MLVASRAVIFIHMLKEITQNQMSLDMIQSIIDVISD